MSVSLADSAPSIRHLRRQPVDDDRPAAAGNVDLVVVRGAIDGHRVGRIVAGSGAGLCRQVDGDLGHVGPGEVINRDGVRAAQHIELDMLDTAEVHRHAADIAKQASAVAVGRDIDLLANIGAVEQQRIGAVLAFDDVAAIARIPLKHVVSGAEQCGVTALITVDEVVSVAANQEVVAGAAKDRVIAAAAINRERELPGREPRRIDGVVAAKRVNVRASRWRLRCQRA